MYSSVLFAFFFPATFKLLIPENLIHVLLTQPPVANIYLFWNTTGTLLKLLHNWQNTSHFLVYSSMTKN